MTTQTSTTTESKSFPVTYTDIEAAAKRLTGVVHKTPILTSKSDWSYSQRWECRLKEISPLFSNL
jgi:threonine dehydratase